jgi:hypothetical protein
MYYNMKIKTVEKYQSFVMKLFQKAVLAKQEKSHQRLRLLRLTCPKGGCPGCRPCDEA